MRVTGSTRGSTRAPGDAVLRMGSSGSAVSQLQRQLEAAGFDPGAVDGLFGPKTDKAVRAYQRARGLSVDGVVGPKTWGALRGPAPSRPEPRRWDPETSNFEVRRVERQPAGALRQQILRIASDEIGTTESGNNRGECLKYPQAFGRRSEAWCADFVSWVMTRAGKDFDDASCRSIVASLKANGQWKGRSNPQPGDLVLFDLNRDRVADHIGFVKSVGRDGTIRTIEGNTENERTGRQGVWERTRSLSEVLGFGDP